MTWTTSECVPWPGRVDPAGYGTLGNKLAHRLMWQRVNGPIPGHLTVDHLCRQRDCINPAHLRLATHEEQTENRKPRAEYKPVEPKTHCANGHRFDYENTYHRKGGGRSCRKCAAANTRRYKARKSNEEEL